MFSSYKAPIRSTVLLHTSNAERFFIAFFTEEYCEKITEGFVQIISKNEYTRKHTSVPARRGVCICVLRMHTPLRIHFCACAVPALFLIHKQVTKIELDFL
jgi:hypothetical protein